MHKITFYPIGNADCCKIDLHSGKKLLFDFAHYSVAEDDDDKRIDLAGAIREDLQEANRSDFDVVAFTHADDDHIHGFSDFFYLEHASKYQEGDRIIIKELWVPAAMIIEQNLTGEARILRTEARHRLKSGQGIRVFSRPDRLKQWLEDEGLSLEVRSHLITDAGNLVPGYTLFNDGIEFFVHSPFAIHVDGELFDRNESSIILHAIFEYNNVQTKFILIGDTTHNILSEIVDTTKAHNNKNRLEWDIFDVPHHCSYKALSDDKGEHVTTPAAKVQWLLEQGREKGIIVSCSKPIPSNDNDNQPPHRQAANYYKNRATAINGKFEVTMEYPTISSPSPMIITIDQFGATLKKIISSVGSASVLSRPAHRAGRGKNYA